jgi:flagellin
MEAMNTNRQLKITGNASEKLTKSLSSGYRINTAADDAAGLSISEKMRKQIRGLTQAAANAEDGISMVQIADGALEEVQDMLQRMNELCVQAANGTNSSSDRDDIQQEISQLSTEIDRVAETTKYNETYLLGGDMVGGTRGTTNSTSYIALNGSKANQRVSQDDIDNTQGIKIIYLQDEVVTTQTGDGTTSTDPKYDSLKDQLKNEIVPNAVTELLSAYTDTYGDLANSSIGIGLKIGDNNTMGSSTLAYVSVGYLSYNDGTVVPNFLSYQLCVNVDALTFDSNNQLTEDSRNKLEVTIVHEMMHGFMDEALTNGMTGTVDGKKANDRFPKWFIEGMAQTAAGGYYDGNDWINGGLGISTSTTTDQIKSKLSTYGLGGSDNACNYGTGYLACMYLGYLSGGSTLDATSIQTGLDSMLKEIKDGKSLEEVVTNLTGYSSLDEFQNKFASDSAALQFVKDLTAYVGGGTGGVVGGLTTTNDILGNTSMNVSLFALDTTHETVRNTYPAGYTVFNGGATTNTNKNNSTGDLNGIGSVAASRHYVGSKITLQIGADASEGNKMVIYIDAMNAASLGVNAVNVTDEDLATNSIDIVSKAIKQVSEQRAELGAYQNRLEHTIKNLDNIVENTTSSESQIRDTDMSTAMVSFSNVNIIAQAGQSILAQANQSNQGVLSLLG